MARYTGIVGYVTEEETKPGVWSKVSRERRMHGTVLREAIVFQGAERFNKNITMQNRISLIGDTFSFDNFYNMQWITYMGTKWEINLIDIAKPRIIITLGGRWNE